MYNHHQTLGFVVRPLNTTGHVVAHPVPRIARGTYSFFYLKSGEVLTEVGGESFLLGADTFLLIPPEVEYSVQWYNNAQAMMGAFEESFIAVPLCSMLRMKQASLCKIPADDSSLVAASMDKLMREQGKLYIAQITLDFVLHLLSEHFIPDAHRGVQIATQFVDEVFNRSQPSKTIAEYAADYGVTPGHLNKMVRTNTGRSASEWVQISRLNYAKYLLHDTQLPIIDVAARVGLFDQSYFSRFFKKHTGMSPLEYRSEAHQ